MLGIALRNTPGPVPGATGLWVLNIDPDNAAESYRQRVLAQMGAGASAQELSTVREQLSGACTTEIASFDEFSSLLAENVQAWDHIVFDTAPTGHTLRLMSLAKAWDQYLGDNTSGTSCLGPLAGLEKQRVIYEATVNVLADANATTLVLVSRPQLSALREAERTSGELRALGVANQCLVINGTFEMPCPGDVTAQAMEQRGASAMNQAEAGQPAPPTTRRSAHDHRTQSAPHRQHARRVDRAVRRSGATGAARTPCPRRWCGA